MLGPSGASSCGSASKARCPETQSRAGTGVRPLNFGTLERQNPATSLRPAFFVDPADAGEGSASQLLAGRTGWAYLCEPLLALVKHAEQPQQNDDGDWDADQPEENAAHGAFLFVLTRFQTWWSLFHRLRFNPR